MHEVTAVQKPTASVRCVKAVTSISNATGVYRPKTTQLLAVKPNATAWIATDVEARDRGRRHVNSRWIFVPPLRESLQPSSIDGEAAGG